MKAVKRLARWWLFRYIKRNIPLYESRILQSSVRFSLLLSLPSKDKRALAEMDNDSLKTLAIAFNAKLSNNAIVALKNVLKNGDEKKQ